MLAILSYVVLALSALLHVHAAPVDHDGLSVAARNILGLAARQDVAVSDASSGPRFVVYSDQHGGVNGPPPASKIKGFNVFALAFWMTSGPSDKLTEWTSMSADKRASVKAEYKAAGISLIVSAFGAEDTPTTKKKDPTALANQAAAFVKKYDLDGIDIDYEDFSAVGKKTAAPWLITFSKALRAQLPQGKYIISHAPIAPWFGDDGPYLTLDKEAGDLIDFYNVQFYNQGIHEYMTCDGLLHKSTSNSPHSSLFEIAKHVSLNKLVIGKPGIKSDADPDDGDNDGGGYMTNALLADCAKQAHDGGWNGGVMSWEYPHADAAWIKAVRSKAWPL